MFSRYFKQLLIIGSLFSVFVQPAAAQSGGSDVQQEVINGVIQNIIQSVRDQIRARRVVAPVAPGAFRFSGEVSDFDSRDPFAGKGMENPFGALAYAKAPILPPAAPAWLYGLNLVGSADRAYHYLQDTGTSVRVETITGAADVTRIGVFTTTDALTFIGTGSHSWSRTNVTSGGGLLGTPDRIIDASVPSTSATLAYLNGGFSADFTVLASWVHNTLTRGFTVPIPDTSSVAYTGNAQYRFDFPYSVWIEPSAGFTYTEVFTASFGTKIADNTEVHFGGRFGTEMKWMGFTIQPVLSGAYFRIVESNILTPGLPVGASVATPGLNGARGSGKVTVLWTPNFSSYLEVHGSTTESSTNFPAGGAYPPTLKPAATQIVGAQAGLRYTF